MAEIPDVVALETIEAQWGNLIRDRTAQRYVDATERDFLNGAPVAGDLAFLSSTDQFQVYDGVAWQTLLDQSAPVTLTGIDGDWLIFNGGANEWKLNTSPTFNLIQDGVTRMQVYATAGGVLRNSDNTDAFRWGGGSSTYQIRVFDNDGTTNIMDILSSGSNVTPQLRIHPGTSAKPVFTFLTDPDTGLFSVGANRLGFSTGGQQIANISPPTSYATDEGDGSQTVRDILVGQLIPDNAWGKDGDVYMRYDIP